MSNIKKSTVINALKVCANDVPNFDLNSISDLDDESELLTNTLMPFIEEYLAGNKQTVETSKECFSKSLESLFPLDKDNSDECQQPLAQLLLRLLKNYEPTEQELAQDEEFFKALIPNLPSSITEK